jgi:tyrosinase
MGVSDPVILFYARAVAEMKALPLSNPLSWRYQAARHDYIRAEDPFAVPGEALPPAADQTRFWAQCQHTSWFFLPWHRMYLHHFEQIVISHVTRLGGPSDWALPYWNYSASTAAARLPAAFSSLTLAGISPNPLLVRQRDANANAGLDFASSAQTDTTACLAESSFEASGASPGFGGPRIRTHAGGPGFGALEGTPHGSMHMAIAGPPAADPSAGGVVRRGFMANFVRAPLDPIFWLHHCNIDRLWQEWLRGSGHANPTAAAWLNEAFDFHNSSGAAVSMRVSEVVNTRRAPLSYRYDDEP